MNPVPLFLIIVTLPLLLGGCGEKHEGVNWEELEISGDISNEIAYHKGSPYTGKSYKLHPNGQRYTETNYKDGKEDGLYVMWFENGQKAMEGNYKDGKEEGVHLMWHKNGQKSYEGNWKNGKQDGLEIGWYENGQKEYEVNWKNGDEIISAKFWSIKGEPVDSREEAETEAK